MLLMRSLRECDDLVTLAVLTEPHANGVIQMMKAPKFLFLLLTTLLLDLSAAAEDDLTREIKAATLVKEEQQAPDFTYQTTDGKALTLSALKGKVVVLYFFSTKSLPACVSEMRYLEKEVFLPLGKREDFQLIGLGRGHTREELVQIGGEQKLTFPLVADTQQDIYQRYFTKFSPRMIVVGKNGKIASLSSGHHEFEGIVKLLAILTKELAEPAP